MASFLDLSPIFLTLLPLLFLLLISPSHSLTCTSQTFPPNTPKYATCSDLPSLKASLHWTFDPTNSTLSIAYIAPPAMHDGWVAWGINPIKPAMKGTQALVALKDSTGSLVVKTYNLMSYTMVEESPKLWFKVLDSKAEDADGTMKIFAVLELPVKNMASVNHIWQVGGSATNGVPQAHHFEPENLGAKGTLDLLKGVGVCATTSPVTAGGVNATTPPVTAGGVGAPTSPVIPGGVSGPTSSETGSGVSGPTASETDGGVSGPTSSETDGGVSEPTSAPETGGGEKNDTAATHDENEKSGGVKRGNVGVFGFLISFGMMILSSSF